MAKTLDDEQSDLLPLPAMGIKDETGEDDTDIVDATLIFLGLDNAGKSTIMQLLANDRLVSQQPTLHPSSLEFIVDKVRYKTFDLAGHETGRRLWKEYYGLAKAVFFLVDAADHYRFPEAAEEIAALLAEDRLKAVPIAVLGMKTDLAGAASEDAFREAMGLTQEAVADNVLKLFMCSVIEMDGCHRIGEAINWLSAHIREHPMNKPSSAQPAGAPTAAAAKDLMEYDDDMMV